MSNLNTKKNLTPTTNRINRLAPIAKQIRTGKIYQPYLLAVSLILLCVLGFAFYFNRRSSLPSEQVRLPQIEGKKTVAVMFFENQSNSAELEWLREGLADMLIANLSRSEKLTVLSRIQLQSLLERQDFSKR